MNNMYNTARVADGKYSSRIEQGVLGDLRNKITKSVTDMLLNMQSPTDEEVMRLIGDTVGNFCEGRNYSGPIQARLVKEVFQRIRRLDVLQDFLDDDTVSEIMVNGLDEIYVERGGRIVRTGVRFESRDRLLNIIGQIASGVNRSVNLSNPILDARLADGSRVNIVLEPIAINGPILTIRRFPKAPLDAKALIESESVTEEVLELLSKLVAAGYNILISGGTGSGKTTMLNCLSEYIPKDARIITIEDSAELKIRGISNLVRLETRNALSDNSNQITIRDLIKCALRMRPDRIIVGETRGDEAIDMLQAFSVGQDGSLSTIHANSAKDALSRLETMVMLGTDIPIHALRRQIASGVDIIVHLERMRDKRRHVCEVLEVTGMSDGEIRTNTLYEFKEYKSITDSNKVEGTLEKVNELSNTGKLLRAGIEI